MFLWLNVNVIVVVVVTAAVVELNSCLLSVISFAFCTALLFQFLPWQSYLSLVPVIVGVSVASVSELSFSAYCLMAGIMSNIFAAARGVFGKQQMSKNKDAAKKIKDISPENYYSIVTTISFLMLVPVSLLFEGKELVHALTHLADGKAAADFKNGMSNAFLSGKIK